MATADWGGCFRIYSTWLVIYDTEQYGLYPHHPYHRNPAGILLSLPQFLTRKERKGIRMDGREISRYKGRCMRHWYPSCWHEFVHINQVFIDPSQISKSLQLFHTKSSEINI
jgi:hypothetical protein